MKIVATRKDGKIVEFDWDYGKESFSEAAKRAGLPAIFQIDSDAPKCPKCGSTHLYDDGECADCNGQWKSSLS